MDSRIGWINEDWIGNRMAEPHAVEKYVRRKNQTYEKWRKQYRYRELNNLCVEFMFVFDALPRWEEFVAASRRRDYLVTREIEREHREWKTQARTWLIARGAVSYSNQAAQFFKFYFAWYRYKYEERHGPILRKYGRQMG
jgi:hypothetical protein